MMVTFLGVEIETGPGVLVPRGETELLGRTALDKLRATGGTLIDVCCGTGNLACAIAIAAPDTRAWALDLTDTCVALARANVARLDLGDRVTVLQGDLYAPLAGDGLGEIDVIACNPPYISTGKLETRDDLAGEPREAFDGGPYGITIHQRVAREAVPLLRPGGWLVFEFGAGQERQLDALLRRTKAYDLIELISDDAGTPRVIAARKQLR
jgi:HemK-like putative methylase